MCAGCKLGILPSSFVHQVVKPMKQQASIQAWQVGGVLGDRRRCTTSSKNDL